VNSVEPQFGQTPSILSSRQRSLHFLQSTNVGEVSKCPDAAQTAGGRGWRRQVHDVRSHLTMDCHQTCLTLRSMLTPNGVVVGGAESAVISAEGR